MNDELYKAFEQISDEHINEAANYRKPRFIWLKAIAAVLALVNSEIPPTINLDEPDPECDLDYTPNKAVKSDLTIAISDSLGFGGHNGCLAFRKFVR